ncbi:MAG: 4-hydroxy-tetrahydrodipicolinate synthase [Bacteroidales bacterium]|nr:4-hydroxy-tetrahydrodipicolinate synthase [Bacteroidales bacterium]
MKHTEFTGAGAAIITPFKSSDCSIDYTAMEKIIEYLIDNEIDYLVVLGSTGEASSLSSEERKKVVEFVSAVTASRVPIVVGCTDNCTKNAVDRVKIISKLKVDAVLSAAPYYNKPSQEGIFRHYKAIAEASKPPVIMYNVPGRTVSNISADTCVRAAVEIPNIVAVKEASGNMDQVMDIINNKPEEFIVLSGEDSINIPLMAVGVEGTISVLANAFPKKFSKMIHQALKGDFANASIRHYELLNMTHLLFKEGNPSGIKAVMSLLGFCENVLRLPLIPVGASLYEEMKLEVEML